MIGKRKSPQLSTIESLKQLLADANETIWTVDSFAQTMCLTREAVKKRIYRGQIPAHKKGRSWYILKSEYLKYLKDSSETSK